MSRDCFVGSLDTISLIWPFHFDFELISLKILYTDALSDLLFYSKYTGLNFDS
jgi:hypothetical protein